MELPPGLRAMIASLLLAAQDSRELRRAISAARSFGASMEEIVFIILPLMKADGSDWPAIAAEVAKLVPPAPVPEPAEMPVGGTGMKGLPAQIMIGGKIVE